MIKTIPENILRILSDCTIDGNIVRLPEGQLDRGIYEQVNKCLTDIGGKWDKRKAIKGHLFDDDPTELMENLINSGVTESIKQKLQFFETPPEMAQRMVELAEIKLGDTILEPSAGLAGIAKFLPRENLLCVEFDHNRDMALTNMGYDSIECDFLGYTPHFLFDRVVMNPPFSKQQDISHVLHAWSMLEDGGIMVSVVSASAFFRTNKKSIEFQQWLQQNNADIYDNQDDAFKASGAMVRTKIIKARKRKEK